MSTKSQKDQYLDDEILGRPGAAQKLRRVPQAMAKALTEAGLTHKAYKGIADDMQSKLHDHIQKITGDPELQAKLHQTIADHHAAKAAAPQSGDDEMETSGYDEDFDQEPMGDGDGGEKDFGILPLHEDPEGGFEAEDEEEQDNEFGTVEPGSLKAQAGYEEPDRGAPVQSPPLVSQAITKRPGNFPPPVPEQIHPTRGDNALVKELRRMQKSIDDLALAMGELAHWKDVVDSARSEARQASSDPTTVINNPDLMKAVKDTYGKPDQFWHSNLQS